MTVLTAAQEAAIELSQAEPASLFSNTNAFARELRLQANRAAVDIAKEHDWQKLVVIHTLTGDGSTIEWDLPADYDRMVNDGKVYSSNFRTATFRLARDLNEWRYLNDNLVTGAPGNWFLLGGKMQIYPAMAVGETARFYYVTTKINGDKSSFDADGNVFKLSERVLALGMVWRWRSSKRQDYSDDFAKYDDALKKEIARDKGARIVTVGAQRMPADVTFAYPGTITT